MSELVERVARQICAHSFSGFCQNVGGDLGCKCGRGTAPSADICIATLEQLNLAGYITTATLIIADMRKEALGE